MDEKMNGLKIKARFQGVLSLCCACARVVVVTVSRNSLRL